MNHDQLALRKMNVNSAFTRNYLTEIISGKESLQNKSSPNFVCYFEDEHFFLPKILRFRGRAKRGSIEATTWSVERSVPAKRSKVGQNIGDFLPKNLANLEDYV